MKKGLHHVALSAVDLNETIHFYETVFGFKEVRRWGDENPIVMMDVGDGTLIEIFSNGNRAIACDEKWPHLAVAVEDVDSTYKAALALGAKSHREPSDICLPSNPPLPARIAFIYGPSNELIEMFCEKE